MTTPAASIGELINQVQSFDLQHGIAHSLIAKLQNALAAANEGGLATACNLLSAFTNQVNALAGHQIPTPLAEQLIAAANQSRVSLSCP